LIIRTGGRGRFGYVLRDLPVGGDSLAFEQHDPEIQARRADLADFGATVAVDEVFDVPQRFHVFSDAELLYTLDEPGAARVVSGRNLSRDETITPPDNSTR